MLKILIELLDIILNARCVQFHIAEFAGEIRFFQLVDSCRCCCERNQTKGKEKVTAEFALSALAYDIRRAINICGGVQKLIERYRRLAMPKIRKITEF